MAAKQNSNTIPVLQPAVQLKNPVPDSASVIAAANIALAAICEAGGGIFVGVQENPYGSDLVLVTHRIIRTTLAVPIHDLTIERVRERLREKSRQWKQAGGRI
jgi:hypothetical protein